ncbi:uncharacterized protein LOC132199443 isoform X2 [Neocloeon triangulifer]|uniref:uncharacterized protein LOC132199443 isoform X2 n=1 Tax=Neocloeon triangulifer TaxID=2078957 RepID=UPI00286EF3F2|nr:uncharacterized protein LOC132199443 isoform X2 [Neocloeon triangulifer]
MALNKKSDHNFSSKMLKPQEKSKAEVKTLRFQLTLGESNEKTCPELNFRELVESEEKRASKKIASLKDGKNSNLMDVDDDERLQMEAMARKFEEKYGGTGKPKKRKKEKQNEEYRDLGAGYDDNDSFIDNTEVYDEIVPCEMTTAQGGFYINCGALEFKQVEIEEAPSDDEDQVKSKKKKNSNAAICSDSSSDDDEDDSDDDEDDDDDSEESDGKEEPEKVDKPKESQPSQPAAIANGVVKAVETPVIATSKEVSNKVLKRPPPDSAPNDVPPIKKPSSSPEIIEVEPKKEIKKPAKPLPAAPQGSAISIETALKNVPDLTVTMKPQQKPEVKQQSLVVEPAKPQLKEVPKDKIMMPKEKSSMPKEKSSSKPGSFFQQLRAAVATATYQREDKRLNNEKSSPLEAPWNREISNLVEKNMDLLLIDGRLNKEVIESKFLPLWPNSWMFRDNLYLNLNSLLRKLKPNASKPIPTSLLNSSQTTITPIPPKPAKQHRSDQSNSHNSSGSKEKYSPGSRQHEPHDSRDSKIMYARSEPQVIDDLLTQVIKEHLPSPKPSTSRPSQMPSKSEPSRHLKLVPEEDLRSLKTNSSPALSVDSEASVQMEMRRVMQELVELNERRSIFPSSVTVSEAASGSTSSRMSAATASRLMTSAYNEQLASFQNFLPRHCDDKQNPMDMFSNPSLRMPQMAKAGDFRGQPASFLTNQIGFQDEFQRHLTSVRNPTDPLFPQNLPTERKKNK